MPAASPFRYRSGRNHPDPLRQTLSRHQKGHCRFHLALLEEPNILFESPQAICSALNDFMDAPAVKTADESRNADFSDALIIPKAKSSRSKVGIPISPRIFDQAALALDGTQAL